MLLSSIAPSNSFRCLADNDEADGNFARFEFEFEFERDTFVFVRDELGHGLFLRRGNRQRQRRGMPGAAGYAT